MKKILILDDDVDIAFVVKTILEMNGYESDFISSYKDLEDKLVTYSPDLLILDISLDGADGRLLCKKLKMDKLSFHTPIILFSANRDTSLTFKDYDADAFISKPFESNKLISIVNSFVIAA